MSNDSISRVYQFLAKQGDWVSAADKNGDGAVIKTEFRNFMEENFEWDGETTDAGKNDLINSFWNSIDTDQSGKIKGTNLKDKNALNSAEIDAMQDRIEMYEILNEFTSTINAPSVVSDAAGWKKSVSEGLGALVEQYIKEGGKAENLQAYLAEKAPAVQQKTTADYCANEYLKDEMSDFVKEYSYSYADDGTLQGIIDTYIQNIPADTSFEDIKDKVIDIIDAYLSTAGLKDGDPSILADYGYNATEDSPINDLQKSIIKKNIETALEEVKNKEDYEANSSLYDTAISDYITNLLAGAKFGDFEELQGYGLTEFEASDNYKTVEKTIEVKNVFGSDELTAELTNAISESFAQRLSNIMAGELTAYDNLINEALTKTQNGDFDTANGELDKDKLIDWIVNEAKTNLSDFYPNGFGDMPIDELNITYDALVESAKEQQDAAKIKEAAISYCNALCDKSTVLANAVKDIFGTSYATEINKLLSGEIEEKMTQLKAKALELGDASTFTLGSFSSGIDGNSLVMETGASSSHVFSATVLNGSQAIDSSRITYSAKCSGSGVTCTIESGTNTLTIQGATAGTYTIEVQVLADGMEVGSPQKITVTVKPSNAELIGKVTGWNGATVEHLEALEKADGNNLGDQVTTKNFADLYNNDVKVVLHCARDKKGNGWDDGGIKDLVKGRLQNLGTAVVSALSTAGLDNAKLNTAVNTVVNNYMSNYHYYKKNSGCTAANCYNYMKDNRVSTASSIVNVRDTNGKDSNIYAIHFKDFVDDILEEYWKLVG